MQKLSNTNMQNKNARCIQAVFNVFNFTAEILPCKKKNACDEHENKKTKQKRIKNVRENVFAMKVEVNEREKKFS